MENENLDTYLVAGTAAEKQIKAYIIQNASQELVSKILKDKEKNISDCLSYIASEVRSQAKNGCAACADEEVYGMAIHYFEEDEIKPNSAPVARVETSATTNPEKPKKPKKPKPEPKEEGPKQTTLFDFIGE